MNDPIKVLLAEDQQMLLGAFAALLEMTEEIQVVAQVTNGEEALEAVKHTGVNIILTDIEMPRMTGLELAQAVKGKIPVIIVTTFARRGYLRRAMEAGVKGYLLKDAPSEQLVQSIEKVLAGQVVVDPALATQAWQEQDPLTDQQRKVLRLASEGLTTEDIAKRVFRSEGTVRNYLSEAIHKMGAKNRVEAARIARENGWL